MARKFRPYGKKRGGRLTGSRWLGTVGEGLFFLFFLGMGTSILAYMLRAWILPEWRVNRQFVEHECTVAQTTVRVQQDDDGVLFRPEVLVRYRVGDDQFESWTYDIHLAYSSSRPPQDAIANQFEIGKSYICWYDPHNPSAVVLVRGYTWWLWVLLILPTSFVILGSVGLIRVLVQSSTSVERRAAIAKMAAKIDLFDSEDGGVIDCPNIPACGTLSDSPGTRLAYRLPIDTSPRWILLSMFFLCIVWNGFVVWTIIDVINHHMAGNADWSVTVVIIPLGIIGLGILVLFIRRLLMAIAMGATRLEISGHPLYPDHFYQLFLCQMGRLKINWLETQLLCLEEATYQQGTDTRTALQCVCRQPVYRRESFEVRPGMPFEDQCHLHVPPDAMHSFKSDHNEIRWNLRVRADIVGWPDYERLFPVLVYPAVARKSPGDQTDHHA